MIVEFIDSFKSRGAIATRFSGDHRSSNKDKMIENANQDRKSERTPTNTLRFQRPRRWNPQAVDSRKVVQT